MAEIDINFIPIYRKYLEKFVNSHYKDFFLDMGEYRPHQGYGHFPYSSEIVQCMREITHILGDVFSDLSIPEKFNSPDDLIKKAKWFIDHLESFDGYFKESVLIIRRINSEAQIPDPISGIDKNRENTIEVFRQFVMLAERELSESGSVSFLKTSTSIEKIENLIEKFHDIACQILLRHNTDSAARPTIVIQDEYDVQDLLHGLLKIYFSDIRAEEWIPSYAGSSKRSDFLLKDEKIIIEVKKTRTKLRDKHIGEQLIIDIANYKKHADCENLICFVYDPDKLIVNPRGLENDLKEISPNFNVFVFVRP